MLTDGRTSYWVCREDTTAPRYVSIILSLIFEVPGLFLSALVFQLLCRITGKAQSSLVLLRFLVFSCFVVILFYLLDIFLPSTLASKRPIVNHIYCVLWTSHFLRWTALLMGANIMLFFIINQSIQVVCRYQYSFNSSKYSDHIYLLILFLFSVCLATPQIFTHRRTVEGECLCDAEEQDLPFLTVAYAGAFLQFLVVYVFNGSLIAFSCYKTVRTIHATPSAEQNDALNGYYFMTGTKEDVHDLEEESKGWRTGSFIMLPMTLSYLICFLYDTLYQFLSAVGFTVYIRNGFIAFFGNWLFVLHSCFVPAMLLYYIPVLRGLVRLKLCTFKQYIISLFSRQPAVEEEAEDHESEK